MGSRSLPAALLVTLMGLFCTTQQAAQSPYYVLNPYQPYVPYQEPFYLPDGSYNGLYHQRLFFGGGNPFTVTRTTVTTNTATYTSSVTCTKRNADPCNFANGVLPWANGFARRRRSPDDQDDVELIESSPVSSVEPTARPERDLEKNVDAARRYYNVEASFAAGNHHFYPGARQLLRTTTITFTVTTTLISQATRTLNPACNLDGFFFQCP